MKGLKLYELTAHEMRDMLRKKEISAAEILEDTYRRIDSVEGKVNSFIALTRKKALKHAQRIDKAIKEGEELSDLAGIPMAIKDNICTEGVETTCASGMLTGFKPPYSAEAYERLVNAGSIMVGKTRLDEFGIRSSEKNSSTKTARNPWDTERVTGSFGCGSAAAVAVGEACFSLGSDTEGSIRQPAALCGVVGMKPTYGLVSRYGLVAFASSMDQIGPITRDVYDCALVMNCISGNDPKDPASAKVPAVDYRSALINDIKGFKIGIPKEYFGEGADSAIKSVVLGQIKVLEDLGAHVEEMSLPSIPYALHVYFIIASAEASSNLARFDGVRYGFRAGEYKDLKDLYVKTRSKGFGKEVKRRIILGNYFLSPDNYDKYYMKALKARTLIRQDFNRAFEKYDVIISPTVSR